MTDPGKPPSDILARVSDEVLLRALVDSFNGALLVKELDGTIRRWNAGAQALYGYTPEEIIGQNVATLVPEDKRDELKQINDRLRSGHPVPAIETERVRKDGRRIHVSLTLSPLIVDGTVVGGSAMAQDITRRKQVEEELARQTKALARSNTDLEQFTYAVSHDLQEPLRMVTSFMDLLEKRYGDQLDEKAHTYIAYAVDGSRRMQALLDDLLHYSRLGRQTLELDEIPLEKILDEVCADLKLKIEESEAKVTYKGLPTAWGDQTLLRIVFRNLVSNALKFSGDEPPRVEITGERRGHVCHVRVRDHGVGIDPKFADRIFEIFQRLHRKEEIPGTGVGLALTRRAVQRLSGTITLGEVSGPGAAFDLELLAPP